MTGPTDADPAALDRALAPVAGPVDRLLADLLDDRLAWLDRLHPSLAPVGRSVADLVAAGGKRLRPAFVLWGHRAAGGRDEVALPAAAAVELLHTFALVHDDVMDRSALRRGQPAAHERLASTHRAEGLRGDSAWFGVAAGILAGDLAFVWADQALEASPAPPEALAAARRVFAELRAEVTAGQYLDMRLAGLADATVEQAREVALLKSGRYTVTRPLQLGWTLAGGQPPGWLADYGDAVGLAFQLRDDLLALFGDPATTGKDGVADLREGKRTVLMVHALRAAEPAQRAELDGLLGRDDVDAAHVARAAELVEATGARAAVEAELAGLREQAARALDGLAAGGAPEPDAGGQPGPAGGPPGPSDGEPDPAGGQPGPAEALAALADHAAWRAG